MNRWTGSWLGGPGSAGLTPTDATGADWKGRRLGLPSSGPGSLAGTGRRAGQFLVDIALSAGVATVFVQPPRNWSLLVFSVSTVLFLAVLGQTVGMKLLGIRVVRRASPVPGPWPALVRTALLVLLVPALITDADGRGLHDKAAGTFTLRA